MNFWAVFALFLLTEIAAAGAALEMLRWLRPRDSGKNERAIGDPAIPVRRAMFPKQQEAQAPAKATWAP